MDTIDPAADEEVDEGGFELDGERLATGEVAAWLEEHAGDGERVGVAVQGSWRAGTGEVVSVALAAGASAAAWIDVAEISPEDDAALAGVAGRRRRGPRCCTTPRARRWRWPRTAGSCAGWRSTPRSPPTSSSPTSAPTTWPT